MKKLTMLWSSVHDISDEQIDELMKLGELKEMKHELPNMFKRIIDTPSSRDEVNALVASFVDTLLAKYESVMIVQPSGSLLFQFQLGSYLTRHEDNVVGIWGVMYSYSKRISEDIAQPDGSIKKVSLFKHEKFI